MTQTSPTIVIWGAGRIGRGFIGDIFSSVGYDLAFIDQSKKLITLLNKQKKYTVVRAVNENEISIISIKNYKAYHLSQKENIQQAVNNADLVAVCTFPKDFEVVAKSLQEMISTRHRAKPESPLNIVVCTNLVHAGPVFKKYLHKGLNKEELEYFSNYVGVIESLIIRIAPPAPVDEIKKDPLVVWTNGYMEFPIDSAAFKGDPPELPFFRLVKDMRAEEKRKIYTYNMCHAILGYYGYPLGYINLVDCLSDKFIRKEVESSLNEVSEALQQEYVFSKQEMETWINGVLNQTNNPTIGDTVARMAADPIRKLKKEDRLIGPALLCISKGIEPVHIIRGITASLHYRNENDQGSIKMAKLIENNGLDRAIREICKLGNNANEQGLINKIIEVYNQVEFELAWHQKALQAYQLGFKYERDYHGCGQCVYAAVSEILDFFEPQVFNAATGLCGGIGLMNDATCSAFTGGVLAIGQLKYRSRDNFSGDKENKYKNFELVQQFREKFIEEFGDSICAGVHKKKYGRSFDLRHKEERETFEEAGGHGDFGCTDTVGKAAQFTIEVITPFMIEKEKEKDGKKS